MATPALTGFLDFADQVWPPCKYVKGTRHPSTADFDLAGTGTELLGLIHRPDFFAGAVDAVRKAVGSRPIAPDALHLAPRATGRGVRDVRRESDVEMVWSAAAGKCCHFLTEELLPNVTVRSAEGSADMPGLVWHVGDDCGLLQVFKLPCVV